MYPFTFYNAINEGNTFSATNENSVGALQSFTISPSGALSSAAQTIASNGDSPAFATALTTGQVAALNYGSGNGRIIPTTSSPLTFDNSASTITFPPPVGGVSHPHMALQHGNEILVSDLVSPLVS